MASEIGGSIHTGVAMMHTVKTPENGGHMRHPVKPVRDKIKNNHTQNKFDPHRYLKKEKQADLVFVQPFNAENNDGGPYQVNKVKYDLEQNIMEQVLRSLIEFELLCENLLQRIKQHYEPDEDVIEINT
jgi:hypothetical protein